MPTLLFCVGATKAGTSWLHRYLSDHPDCHLRSIKELHYFDALDRGTLEGEARTTLAAQKQLATRLDGAPPARTANIVRQIGEREHWAEVLATGQQDVAAYLGYLHAGLEDQKLVGDITPAYSLLSRERLEMMASIAPDTRFIYLLRDPIARLWSHVRMIAARRSDSGQIERARADRIFERVLNAKEDTISQRCDYRSAIEKLRGAVDPARLMITYYEDLFDGDALARICAFLGISRVAPDLGRRVHAGQPLAMLDQQRVQAREWLAEQYDYVRSALGATPGAWQYDLAKVQA